MYLRSGNYQAGMRINLTVENDDGEVIAELTAPTVDDAIAELGSFERAQERKRERVEEIDANEDGFVSPNEGESYRLSKEI